MVVVPTSSCSLEGQGGSVAVLHISSSSDGIALVALTREHGDTVNANTVSPCHRGAVPQRPHHRTITAVVSRAAQCSRRDMLREVAKLFDQLVSYRE
jgi:hypothetical protein